MQLLRLFLAWSTLETTLAMPTGIFMVLCGTHLCLVARLVCLYTVHSHMHGFSRVSKEQHSFGVCVDLYKSWWYSVCFSLLRLGVCNSHLASYRLKELQHKQQQN